MSNVLVLLAAAAASALAFQQIFEGEAAHVRLSTSWESIGPWPVCVLQSLIRTNAVFNVHGRGTREWPLAAGPCNISTTTFLDIPMGNDLQCPSPLTNNSHTMWHVFEAGRGTVEATFDDVEWEDIRATKGWSALQWQAFLRTTVDVKMDTHAIIELEGGVEFVISSLPSEVHPGNFYGYTGGYGHHVHLHAGRHTISVRQVYDIRSQGDPHARKVSSPSSPFRLHLRSITNEDGPFEVLHDRNIIPDRLPDGRLTADYVGVWLRNLSPAPVTVAGLHASDHKSVARLATFAQIRFGPWEAQQIPIRLSMSPDVERLGVQILYRSQDDPGQQKSFQVELARQHRLNDTSLLRYTYLASDESVQWAMAKPSRNTEGTHPNKSPIVVALHGAGISADDPTWTDSIPSQEPAWVVFVHGRSPWSFDWHAIGKSDILDAVMAIALLRERLSGARGSIPDPEKLIVLGHSNGGQGTWYYASRYPDQVLGVAPAAAYSKIADYVPFDYESSHTIDPALRSVLLSGLTPYDNELHLSNIFRTPVLAQHGSIDDNVPVYHSRRLVALAQQWSPYGLHSLVEIENAGHFWPTVFRNERLQDFVRGILAQTLAPPRQSFTITVSLPDESGFVGGIRVAAVEVPGRIARLEVEQLPNSCIVLRSHNVQVIDFGEEHYGRHYSVSGYTGVVDQIGHTIRKAQDGSWSTSAESFGLSGRPIGPLAQILDGSGLRIVHGYSSHSVRAARRLLTAIQMHGGPRTETLPAALAVQDHMRDELSKHSIVLIGDTTSNRLLTQLLGGEFVKPPGTHIDLNWLTIPSANSFAVHGRIFEQPGYGALISLPHSTSGTANTRKRAVAIIGTDLFGLDRALRAFPTISGTPLPEWVVFSPRSTEGQINSAGWWNATWGWSELMSYLG